MKWPDFLARFGRLPVIESEFILSGLGHPGPVAVQLVRWQKTGRLVRIKRGVYLLGEAYRKKEVFEPYLASVLRRPSYISFEKALEFHGVIPEAVPRYSCVTTARSGRFASPAGLFDYRHIQQPLFFGYGSVTVGGQTGFIARPEKALLDLIYFRGMKISRQWLNELRLQDLQAFDLKKLESFAKRFNSPGMSRAAAAIKTHITAARNREKTL